MLKIFFSHILKCQKILRLDIIEKTKKRLKNNLVKKNKIFPRKKKKIKQQYERERYKNLSENENLKLVEYKKRYYEKLKNEK